MDGRVELAHVLSAETCREEHPTRADEEVNNAQ